MSIEVVLSKAPATKPRQRTATTSRAVICAFAATGILATNIFLPSLPAIAADLRVSSAAVTSSITVFLAICCRGTIDRRPVVGPVGTTNADPDRALHFRAGNDMVRICRRSVGFADRPIDTSLPEHARSPCSRAPSRGICSTARRSAKVMASITIATAAAPGFSPLVGSALDHLFGWRFEFAFVAIFAICAGAAYVDLHRRNQGSRRQFRCIRSKLPVPISA